MVVEHTFITTMEAADALATAGRALVSEGFEVQQASDRALTARRVSGSRFPGRVHLEWDRGRVNVAVSIEVQKKPTTQQTSILINLAQALEKLLTGASDTDVEFDAWRSSSHKASTRVRRGRWVVYLLLAFIAAVIAGMVMSSR